ncbi:MAG TPA: hypothetical protein VE783_00065 [Candidatus Limnocylindrales bacterium]|nr:hypothetical protein [Candidatus Limnocylindrales bacterium]
MTPAISFNADQLRNVVSTATEIAAEIEKLVGASLGGSFNDPQIERLTLLLGNLAAVAIQAVHQSQGKAITPESILALMPTSADYVPPVA